MSELTTVLQTTFSWIKEYYPKLEQSFKPGLSYEEMKNYDDKLGNYYFTSEFYELYQWRNGTLTYPSGEIINLDDTLYILDDGGYMTYLENRNNIIQTIDDIEPFSAIFFCPIDAIDFFRCRANSNSVTFVHPFLFGTCGGDTLMFLNNRKKNSPLFSSVPDEEDCYEEVYTNLTAKFLDLADSIESKAYSVNYTEHGKVLFVDKTKICRKRRIFSKEDNFLYLE